MTAKDLDIFYRTGMRPATTTSSLDGLVPKILFPFLKPGTLRRLYPLVADGSGVRALADIVNDLVDDSPSSGDELERERRFLYRLEQEVSVLARADETLGSVLDRLAENAVTDGSDSGLKQVEQMRAAAGRGHLLPGSAEGLRLALVHTAQVTEPDDLEWLATRLHDLLDLDRDDHSEEKLTHSVGGSYSDSIDFGSLSHLLDESPTSTAMEPERRARIESTLHALEKLREAVYGTATQVFTDVEAIESERNRRLEAFVALMKTRRVAQLEIENRYRTEFHDAVFASFGPFSIPAADFSFFPAVLGHLHNAWSVPGTVSAPGRMRLLVTFDELFTDDGELTPGIHLARTLVGLGTVYVQQVTLSLAHSLIDGLTRTATTASGSVLVVYTGQSVDDRFLSSAVACDTRLVPAFRYDPTAGQEWADRFDLSDNEQVGEPWAELDGRPATPADVLALDPRFSQSFLRIPDDMDTDTWSPVGGEGTHVRLDMATEDGTVTPVALGPQVRRTLEHTATSWRLLQEWAGIRSSLVDRARTSFETDVRAVHEEELADIQARHEATLNEKTSTLADRIVTNIAAGLLGMQNTTPAPGPLAASPTAPSRQEPETVQSAPEPESPAAQEEDDDEPLVLDDAYIDTPLCTSCNECTNLNGLMFGYDENKQAFIKDASAGPYRDLVLAAEKCPVRIIHPGKPLNADEPDLAEWEERAAPFR